MTRLAVQVALLSSATALIAEQPLDPRVTAAVLAVFEARSFDDGGFTLPYRLLSPPEASKDDPRPLLLFLHGMGERGDDNQRQLIHGGAKFADPAFRAKHRAYVLAPQCPGGTLEGVPTPDPTDGDAIEAKRAWTPPLWTEKPVRLDLAAPMTPQLTATRRLVDRLIERLPIDPDRVYVMGLSMGGYATWELAAREPDFWAAAAPICGGGDPRHGGRIARLPLRSFHGDADRVVPVDRSREMIAAINAAGGTAVSTEYPGIGHDSWTPTLGSPFFWDWLFAQRR